LEEEVEFIVYISYKTLLRIEVEVFCPFFIFS